MKAKFGVKERTIWQTKYGSDCKKEYRSSQISKFGENRDI